VGQTSWYSKWETKQTLIILLLRGETEEMKFEIGFKRIDLSDQEYKVTNTVSGQGLERNLGMYGA